MKGNWLDKTLEQLEKDYWGEPTYDSYLVTTCHKLRKKQLRDFNREDLRIMIGQSIGLPFLIPLAIEDLKDHLFDAGDYYKGDLLTHVLRVEKKYWIANQAQYNVIYNLT